MANRLFRGFVQALLTGSAPDLSAADLRLLLIDTADHDPDTTIVGDTFLADIPAPAREAVTLSLQNVTVVDGVVDADDIELPDDGGDQAEELVIYNHTGNEATSLLIACIDEATGLPITPDGVADEIQWDPAGILSF